MQIRIHGVLAIMLATLLQMRSSPAQQGLDTELVDLTPFTVYAGSHSIQGAPALRLSDRMAREARVDLQSRGGERYQTDISIRGGIFEGTGLMVGGLALFDPQTGHYFSEIPLDPSFFGGAYLLTGVQNGIHGFNSTAGSINWKWAPMKSGGSLHARIGTDSHIGGAIRNSAQLGGGQYEVSLMHESGDGSIRFGDFDLSRLSGRIEYAVGKATLRLFGGYLHKFYGWPGMYTGFPLNETDEYAVSLLGWQLDWQDQGTGSGHRIGGYWRQVDDDYEFSRENPNHFFEHKTEVFSLQGDGRFSFPALDLVYRWSAVTDQILRSTSLVNGDFNDRDYGEAGVLLEKAYNTDWGEWTLYSGAAIDTSNRDSTTGSPQVGLRASGIDSDFNWSAYLEYAESSQVPGYTVLNSAPSGLFGGNKSLGRETTSFIETGYSFQTKALTAKIVIFRSQNDNLVDWVYNSESPTSRQAAAVDIEVDGMESWIRWEHGGRAVELGYTWLDKDEDYRDAEVDASFYALNYARHRLLVTWEQQLAEGLLLRIEGEFREHPDNMLRSGGDEALFIHADCAWNSAFGSEWDFSLRATNLTSEAFQRLPGTPGSGREILASLKRDW